MKYIVMLFPLIATAPTSGKLEFYDLLKIRQAIFDLRTEQDMAERQLRKINLGPSAANLLQVKTEDVSIVLSQLPTKTANLVAHISAIEYKLDFVNIALIEAVLGEQVIGVNYVDENSLDKVDDKFYVTENGEYIVQDYTIIERVL